MSDAASMVFARWRVLTGARWSKLDGACKITRLILPYNPDQKKLQDHPTVLKKGGKVERRECVALRSDEHPEVRKRLGSFESASPSK